ncbi:Alpha/Beta hydrolase protein [Phyllosticta citribraziliensis]|uniref:Alpha/Beta hydrolase protein n=1 Tax=Phyllosticta citribraziliensis TaxID=989973 RepID=A0ABR1LIR6_9PEZI
MAPTPGILYVTMNPHNDLSSDQFHDWYNNEHGPTRLRFPYFLTGFRYKATDLAADSRGSKEQPEWMAMYDVDDLNQLNTESYLSLRGPPLKSEREAATMKKIDVNRKSYDLIYETKKEGYKSAAEIQSEGRELPFLLSAIIKLKPGADAEEFNKWYNEEHIPLLTKVPGWRQTRRFKSSTVVKPLGPQDKIKEVEYIALHEFDSQENVEGPELKACADTPWTHKMKSQFFGSFNRRDYKLYYTFGPAPRYLSSLTTGSVAPFTSPDGLTKEIPATPTTPGAIESYITARDGVILPYRLEGSPDPNAPLIILSTSVMVDWHIYDAFLASFLSQRANQNYRILRYHTRGRGAAAGTQPITIDVLADDMRDLLDALRVPRAAAAIGVSLGGVSVLNLALKHPSRVAAFVACDTNAAAPATNAAAWDKRVGVAEAQGATAAEYGGAAGIPEPWRWTSVGSVSAESESDEVIGENLAEETIRRWFVDESFDKGEVESRIEEVKRGVATNSLEGFKKVVRALHAYDVAEEMKGSQVPGAFLAGAGDGAVPKGMRKMAETYGGGKGAYYEVEHAGHLPMVEKPDIVAGFVTEFLEKVREG